MKRTETGTLCIVGAAPSAGEIRQVSFASDATMARWLTALQVQRESQQSLRYMPSSVEPDPKLG